MLYHSVAIVAQAPHNESDISWFSTTHRSIHIFVQIAYISLCRSAMNPEKTSEEEESSEEPYYCEETDEEEERRCINECIEEQRDREDQEESEEGEEEEHEEEDREEEDDHIHTGDFLLDLIQGGPTSNTEDDGALPASGSQSISWENVPESRLNDIQHHLTNMMKDQGSRSRSRSPVRATTKAGQGCPCLDEITTDVKRELDQLKEHPRVVIEHFFPEVIDFGIEGNYEILRDHALTKVHHLVEETEPEEFYIGICVSALTRWIGHTGDYEGHLRRWEKMFLLCAADGPTVARLEDELLLQHNYLKHHRCMNKVRGGGRQGPANQMSFLYICRQLYVE